MSGEEINRYFMSSLKLSWDSGIETGVGLEALNSQSIERFVELVRKSNRRPLPENSSPQIVLEKLELIVNEQATRAALLMFGTNPKRYFESAFVKVGRFKNATTILDEREFAGNLIQQMEDCMDWFRDRLQAEVVISDRATRTMDWEYPLDAVREAVANAICHRDYRSDSHVQIRLHDRHLEFWNPGGLPPGLTADDLLHEHESIPRNKRIAESFFLCGFIERWGTGTLRMAESLQSSGHPSPEFDTSRVERFRVTFRKEFDAAVLTEMGFSDRQVNAVLYVKAGHRLTNLIYQENFGAPKRTATRELSELVERKILARHGKTGVGTYYSLP